ncbi:MAG: FAD-dependent oxidoreductase, partial [Gemmatimonadota bacterium]|nr:FAD-dependent oxidoreductase [Gemmatimonadota bacterium]
PVLVPGDAGYEDSRTVWNGMIDRRPALVARCLGTADVIAGVQVGGEHDLLLCIKGGGHNIGGLATADGVPMLDLSLMRGVWVDPPRTLARAHAGCVLGDVDRETPVRGLAAVPGFVSATGIAGPTLAGGFGYLTRRWRWGPTLSRADVVTADGRVVWASSDEHPDFFWVARRRGEFWRRDPHRVHALPGQAGDRGRSRRARGARGEGRVATVLGRKVGEVTGRRFLQPIGGHRP